MNNSDEADSLVHAIAADWQSAHLSKADQALCRFAADLTNNQHLITAENLDELRRHGFDDRAIHDATQVIAYFNYITRIAAALGVEPEDFIEPWGISHPNG